VSTSGWLKAGTRVPRRKIDNPAKTTVAKTCPMNDRQYVAIKFHNFFMVT
jgi:hypothetical protein